MAKYLFYDSDCGFCQRSIDWLSERLIDSNAVFFIAYQSDNVESDYPEIHLEHAGRGVQWLDEERNTLLRDHNAIAEVLLVTRSHKWLGQLIKLPLLNILCGLGYGLVSSNRQLISKFTGTKVCNWGS